MKKLKSQGWKMNGEQLPLEWKDGQPKVSATENTDWVNRRFFFLCLLDWESLKERGLNALPTNKPHAYYKLVLKAAEPANVQLTLSNAEYLSICNVGPVPEPMLALHDHEHEDIEMEDARESDHIDLPPAKRRRTIKAQASPALAVGGSSSSSSAPVPEQEEVPSVQQGFTVKSGVFISGCEVGLEKHLKRGEKGSYCRLIVPCLAHMGCKKRRNVHTEKGLLGVKEALAFLAHWSIASSSFSDKTHVKFQARCVANDAAALAKGMEFVEGDIEELVRQAMDF
jgi:hypothetical protein